MKHTISVLVENHSGVLSRISGLFSRPRCANTARNGPEGFNNKIRSLTKQARVNKNLQVPAKNI